MTPRGVAFLLLRSRGRVRLVQRLAQDVGPLRGQGLGPAAFGTLPASIIRLLLRDSRRSMTREDLARLGIVELEEERRSPADIV